MKLKLPAFIKTNERHRTRIMAAAFLAGGIAVGLIARGAVVNYGSTTTIQGELPPPGYTTYYSNYTGGSCDAAMAAAAAKHMNDNINNHNQSIMGGLASAMQSCLANMSNLPIPGIPSLSMAGLASALENQACQMAQSAIAQVTMPMYSAGGGMLNTQALAGQLSVPGTNGAVNLGSAITMSAPTNPATLSAGPGGAAAGAAQPLGERPVSTPSIFRQN